MSEKKDLRNNENNAGASSGNHAITFKLVYFIFTFYVVAKIYSAYQDGIVGLDAVFAGVVMLLICHQFATQLVLPITINKGKGRMNDGAIRFLSVITLTAIVAYLGFSILGLGEIIFGEWISSIF